MQQYSRLWWASILLSSVVTGGGTFVLLVLLTDWQTLTVFKLSIVSILVGDIVLALLMEAVSPTHVKVGPGERLRSTDLPRDLGKVVVDFADGRGRVKIRGEVWQARQPPGSTQRLDAGAVVRVLNRDGLTLIVASAEHGRLPAPQD